MDGVASATGDSSIVGYKYDMRENLFVCGKLPLISILPQLVWVITDKCRCKCPFCFETKTNSEFNINQLDEYIRLFRKLYVQKIDLSGGETVDYPNLPILCNRLRDNGIGYTISTSGFIQNNFDWLIKNQESFSRIIVSINGFDRDSIDQINGQAGVYDAQRQLLSNIGTDNLRINTVVNRLLVNKERINRLIEGVSEIAPLEWCLIQPHPENKKKTYDEYNVSDDEFRELTEMVSLRMGNGATKIIVRNNDNYNGYWILNAQGKLFHHSMNSEKRAEYLFDSANVESITTQIMNSQMWLATKEG